MSAVKGHRMHLTESHYAKLSSPQKHCNIKEAIQEQSNQNTLHLPLQHTTDLHSHQAAKSFEALCEIETQPDRWEALKAAFTKSNRLIVFPVWLAESHLAATSVWCLDTDAGLTVQSRQHYLYERKGVRKKEVTPM